MCRVCLESRCQLPEYFEGEDPALAGVSSLASAPSVMESVPRLVLRQLRWLDYVVDCRALVGQLLQCLQVRSRLRLVGVA